MLGRNPWRLQKDKQLIEIPRPKAVEIYNQYMGVDLLDAMLGFYRITIRSKKWYHRLFFHMLDMTIVNSYLLWRRRNKQIAEKKQEEPIYMPLLDFKIYIAEVLMRETTGVFTPTTRGRGRPPIDNLEPNKKRRRLELPPEEVVPTRLNWTLAQLG